MKCEQRLKRLEMRRKTAFPDVLEWIRKGRFYDELTAEERQRYCEYRYSMQACSVEECMLLFKPENQTAEEVFHFRLEKKTKPPTPEEMEETRRELDEYFRAK